MQIGTATGEWWSVRTGGLVGGVVGSAVGILGATIGWLVARRRGRAFALGVIRAAVVVGFLLLGVGVFALFTSEPDPVAYPVPLTGIILVAVFGGTLPSARRAYADHELRRICALD